MLTLLYVHGWDGPMIIIEEMDDSLKCAVGVIDVGLALPLDVILLQWY